MKLSLFHISHDVDRMSKKKHHLGQWILGILGLPDIPGAQIHLAKNNSVLSEFPFLDKDEVNHILNLALSLHPDNDRKHSFEMYPPLKVYGKLAKMNRGVGFYSDESIGYRYSGQLSKSKPPPRWMKRLIKRVNEMFETSFNGVLLNFYPDGEHYIGPHSDDESALSGKKVVALSLGSKRIFRIRDRTTKQILKFSEKEVTTIPGRLLVMSGDFQKYYTHEIPKQSKVTIPRISLTFREHSE